MSTSVGQQAMRLPSARETTTMLGAFAAGVVLATTSTLALTAREAAPLGAETTVQAQVAFERPAGHGEMEFPGTQGAEAAAAAKPGLAARPHSGHGGLMELPGLEAEAASLLGEARGGLQQYAETR